MNKVYYFEDGYRDYGVFVAAKNFKEAKKEALCSDYELLAFISYIEIQGHMI